VARILIVDGDPGSREHLSQALVAEGLEVLAAADTTAAWEAFVDLAPRAVIVGRRVPAEEAEALSTRMQQAEPGVLVLGAADEPADLARRLRIRLGAPAPRRLPPSASSIGPGAARVLARPPLERGELALGALPDLLARLWRFAADGIVEVDRTAGASLIFVLRGAPVAVGPAGGEVPAETASLCAASDGTFAFHPGSEFSREISATRGPALAPLLAGLRAAAPEDDFAEALAAVSHAYPLRAAGWGTLAPELDLSAADADFVAALDGSRAAGEVLGDRDGNASLLWFLVRLGAVDLRLPDELVLEAP
jgi:CheY-like chemotaxis protein